MSYLQRLDWRTGHLLRVLADARLYRALGHTRLDDYVRERLSMSTGKAAALIALERRARHFPRLASAFRRGRLSWLQALTLLPVLHRRTAGLWIARAGEVTLRRLTDEVRWALDELDGAGAGTARTGIAPPPAGAHLTGARRIQMCALASDEDREDMLGRPGKLGAPVGAEICDGAIAFSGPASVVGLLRQAIDAFRPAGRPSWVGLVRLVHHALSEWARAPRHPDPIFERDGWRCTVPGCSARSMLHDHHIRFRSRGGDNRRTNRTAVCVPHHIFGIHAGRIRARGIAPNEIYWELGVAPGREPFLRLVGDRYVTRSEVKTMAA
jgi:hypothetical protein